MLLFPIVLLIPLFLFQIAALARIYAKAGSRWWIVFVPIYNRIQFKRIAGLRPSHLLTGPLGIFDEALGLATKFGKDRTFAWRLVFLPFVYFPILGFGSAEYDPSRTVPDDYHSAHYFK